MTTIDRLHHTSIVYPESDGQPMADNTLQFRWIVTIQGGLDALFRDNPQVFIAGDLLWYPVEGQPAIRIAPDVLVAFGRPKGERGSYQQWVEGNVVPQVVFEVLSPGNRVGEMTRKFQFYDRYGVSEYYLYDPEGGALDGWQRVDGGLLPIEPIHGWVSPLLGVRFALEAGELALYRPDGQRFLSYVELARQAEAAQQQAEAAQQQAEAAQQQAEAAQQQAEAAQQQAEAAQQQARAERERAERLAAQLRALGIDPERP